MKKTRFLLISLILIFCGFFWLFLKPNTNFNESQRFFFINSTKCNDEIIIDNLQKQEIISSSLGMKLLSAIFKYDRSIKPGKYSIKKGSNTISIFWSLFKGNQIPVNLVINKYRTRESLAGMVALHLECDSISLVNFLNNSDSMALFQLDTNNAMTLIIPNTYSFFWNVTASTFWKRMKRENEKFWSQERLRKVKELNLTKEQVYILASIIEEETNKNDEKSIISSVYLNRIKKGMPLSADPTVKYAIRDFTIKRITFSHISQSESSPYNTYKNKGLPPGPICTPSIKSIDAVLNAQQTDYLFFCAKPDFSGYHNFAITASEHFKNAHAYQKALDHLNIK